MSNHKDILKHIASAKPNSNVTYVCPISIFPITVLSRWKMTKPIPSGTGLSDFIYIFKQQQPENKTRQKKTPNAPLLYKAFLTLKKSYANHL